MEVFKGFKSFARRPELILLVSSKNRKFIGANLDGWEHVKHMDF